MSLYLFDMDGTLIENYMDSPNRDKDYDKVELLPGRRERLHKLWQNGNKLGIVTNQGGVAFGYVTHEQAQSKIERVVAMLGVPMSLHYCFSDRRGKVPWNSPQDADRRKPSGAMILEAMQRHEISMGQQVIMVGDRPEDCDAAENAGVEFEWADDFFAESEESTPNDSVSTSVSLPNRNMLYVDSPDSDMDSVEARIIDLDTGAMYDKSKDVMFISMLSGDQLFARYDGDAAERMWAALKRMSTII